jgi:signal transduction histidine kinase/CheY-like chemotaxis protein
MIMIFPKIKKSILFTKLVEYLMITLISYIFLPRNEILWHSTTFFIMLARNLSFSSNEDYNHENKDIQNSRKEYDEWKIFLNIKKFLWMRADLRLKQISDKNFSVSTLLEHFREIESDHQLNLQENKDNFEYKILERIFTKIILCDEIHYFLNNSGKFSLNFENFLLIIKNFLDCSVKTKDFYEIGSIITENKFYVKMVVVHARTLSEDSKIEFLLITSKYRKVEDLKETSAINVKSLQLSKIAHEIKNIILVIINTCNHINQDTPNSFVNKSRMRNFEEEGKTFYKSGHLSKKNSTIYSQSLNYINSLGNYLLFLIEDLNVFTMRENNMISNSENLKVLDFELIPALEFCLNIFKNKRIFDSNKFNLKISSNYRIRRDVKIKFNESRLKQIMINLLSNAYKFTFSGDIILGAEYVKEHDKEKKIRISVKDTGCGISDSEKKFLFSPYGLIESNQKLNSFGSGLGLSIVKDFLEKMCSNLEYTSKKFEGTTFWFDVDFVELSPSRTCSFSSLPVMSNRDNETIKLENNHILTPRFRDFIKPFCLDNDASFDFTEGSLLSISEKNHRQILVYSNKKSTSKFRNIEKSKDKKNENLQEVENILIESNSEFENEEGYIIDESNKPARRSNYSIPELIQPKLDNSNSFTSNSKHSNHSNCSKHSRVENSIEKLKTDRKSFKSRSLITRENFSNFPKLNKEINKNIFSELKTKKINVVICDDEATILYSTSYIIRKIARKKNIYVNVITCSNGIECINKIYEEYLHRNFINMVFIDENMPFIRGTKLAKIIKTMSREKQINDISIYLVSACGHEEYTQNIKSTYIDGFFNKPITISSLESVFEEMK